MSPKAATTDSRSRFRFLDLDADQVATEVGLEEFVLHLPEFSPAAGERPLRDGEPPTKLGARFRQAWAEANDIAEAKVDHGLIRDVEALSADHEANVNGLARPYRLRNRAGEQIVVRFTAHMPLVPGALINGRMLSRVGRELPDDLPVLTRASDDHPLVPTLDVVDAEHAYRIAEAQRRVEKLHDYQQDDQDFIDSLALEGVITAPVVAPFLVRDNAGNTGYLFQTDDGWRRATGCRSTLSELLAVNADLTYRHWENPDGTLTIRSRTAETVRRTLDWLRFAGSDRAELLYPSSRSRKSVDLWLRDVAARNPDVRAFHRLRTVEIELVLANRPHHGRSKFDVFYLDMAARHVQGFSPKDWDKASVEGVVAVRAIDRLRDANHVSDAERSVWLGEIPVPVQDKDDTTRPFRNRLVAGTALLATLTADQKTGRRQLIRTALKEHGLPNSPQQAAAVAAAQAAVVFEVDGTAAVGQVTSTLMSLFKHPILWKDEEHPGDYWWVGLIHESPDEVYEGALAEIGEKFEPRDSSVGTLGPYQRVMVALAGVAHVTNKALIERNASITRTGRGGRGGVGKTDPIVFLDRMVRQVDGLARCLQIVRSVTSRRHVVPIDPITDEEMTETWLRLAYLSEDQKGAGEGTDETEVDPEQQWWNDVHDVLNRAEKLRDVVDEMTRRAVPAEVLEAGDDYDEDTAPRMFETYGVPEADSKGIVEALGPVTAFAHLGAAFHHVRRRGE